MTTRRPLVACALAATPLLLGSCTSDEPEQDASPEEVLAEAKQTLDETSGVHIVLSTEELPPGISGILTADGIGTHAPAFEGKLKVQASGITADAEVIAVGDTVYAVLPFTTDFTPIDPADYGAPDPADLMRTDGGLSTLLTSTDDPEQGGERRDGETVLTEYAGTLPGDVVAGIIPTASPDSAFEVTYTITDDNVLNETVITGPFYPAAEDVTYTIRFDQYDTTADIAAP